MRTWNDKNYLEGEYVEKRRSTTDIAKDNGVFPNQIRRALIKNGIPLRDKSEAQKNNIDRNGSPMQGRKRTGEEKKRISSGMQKWWDGLTDDQKNEMKERLSEAAKGKWDLLSEHEKKMAIKKMQAASRIHAKMGSKNENMVANILREAGYTVHQRTKDYAPGRRFEIDICLPKEKIAIEWDGPTHFDPIYGELHLARVRRKDDNKNATLVAAGWTVIRCRDHSTSSSLAFCTRAGEKLLQLLSTCERGKVHIMEAH